MYSPQELAVRESGATIVRSHVFALIGACIDGAIYFGYAPTVLHGNPSEVLRVQFHLARANPLASMTNGTQAKLVVLGPHTYVSPKWYTDPNQVPTWNYVAAECAGSVHKLTEEGLCAHLEELVAQEEGRLATGVAWTIGQVNSARFKNLLNAITGFEMAVESCIGRHKLSQNKGCADRRGIIAGLERRGEAMSLAVAAAMREREPSSGEKA